MVVEPSGLPPELSGLANLSVLTSPQQLAADYQPDIVLFAIKPQHFEQAVPAYARFKNCVYLSIAAGITSAKLQQYLQNQQASVVRCMPNLPASIGQGASGAYANNCVNAKQRTLCTDILNSVGIVEWLLSEDMIDSVTALSGSGPAYVFALCEMMGKAGEALGLSPEIAVRLARQTIIGSGALLAQSHESAETLRKAVTSPAGTTEAALKFLVAPDAIPVLILETMQAAKRRAKELGGND